MRLNLKDIISVPGASVPFDFQLDLTGLEFNGAYPVQEPLQVSGQVQNRGGVLMLEARAVTNLHLTCDRCATPFQRVKSISLDSLVAAELEDEENDEIILLDGDELDVGDVVTTAFILDMDTKNLCSEDCKGLCPHCGANLNLGLCQCKREVDPRLAKLAQLLDD
jgi:uncharacterized protein